MSRMRAASTLERPHTQPAINAYRRRRIIEGALRSVATRGLAATTIKTIAEEAGVSRGLLAHYYGSKDELLAAAYRHLCEVIAEQIATAARASDRGTVGRLNAIVEVVFSPPVFDPVNLRVFVAFWHEALANPGLRAIKHELYAGYRTTTARLFRKEAEERGLSLDADAAAVGLLALLDGLWQELALDQSTCTPEQARAIGLRAIAGTFALAAAEGGT